MIDLQGMATFGVAGNFTGHLEQAGEAADFARMGAVPAGAPKAIFPTYLPRLGGSAPGFLGVFPFDEGKIVFPAGEQRLQIEPECAIVCDATYEGGALVGLAPRWFGASNDCSIRKAGAPKISVKKNWGPSSKGFAAQALGIDRFDEGGILGRYRIASFLRRGNEIHDYGEDSAVSDYSYIYGRLLEWCLDRFAAQRDEGPAEDIGLYLREAGQPSGILLSVGATRYTRYGQENFLAHGDHAVVALYPGDRYSHAEIRERALEGALGEPDISALDQEVVAP
ncbi:MAG: DUF5718 family protein [Succinivibrionaceae bacterium]|nr:DUF5718 family protein [Succinivibrionaceae bacterium]